MTLRVVLIFLLLGFLALLLVMGAITFVRWLRLAHPGHYRSILGGLVVMLIGSGIWGIAEVTDRPSFHAGDLITLQEPLVVRTSGPDRLSPATSCIVEIYQHLAVVEMAGGTMTARVESNKGMAPMFCPAGSEVQFDLAWLHRYSLTRRSLL